MRTERYWAQEKNVPGHDVIAEWNSLSDKCGGKIQRITNEALVDVRRLADIKIEKATVGKGGQVAGSLLVYGAAAGLLLGYEELLGLKGDTGRSPNGLQPAEERASKEQSRRSFFKIGAALAGTAAAVLAGSKIDASLEEGRTALKKEISHCAALADVSNDRAFARYFELPHTALTGALAEQVATARAALEKGVENTKVHQALRSVIAAGSNYHDGLQRLFNTGVPAELGFICNCATVTDELKNASGKQSGRANLGVLMEGLVVAGAMAALTVPAEIVSKKLSEKSKGEQS